MERNLTLDYFKIFLSILVITIHVPPLLDNHPIFSWLISNGIARIAVPFFFAVSGYYLADKINNKKALLKYFKHLFIIYTTWYILYLPMWINILIKSEELHFRQLAISVLMGYSHLWFLPALILGTFLLLMSKKLIKSDKILVVTSIALLVFATILIPYSPLVKLFRNGLFIGLPFIMLGYYTKISYFIKRINNEWLIILIIVSMITLLIESYLNYQKDQISDLYFSLIITTPTLLAFFQKNANYTKAKSYVGELSSAIYFTHIFVITYIINIKSNSLFWIIPIILIAILLSSIIIYLNKRIRIFL